MKTGLFTGTFDPFTIGHRSIVDRALPLFDRLVIGVAVSKLKHTESDVDQRVRAIANLYAGDGRVKVVAYSDLTIDLVRREEATFIVRGVRSDMSATRPISTGVWAGWKRSCCSANLIWLVSAAAWCANWSSSATMSPSFCPKPEIIKK